MKIGGDRDTFDSGFPDQSLLAAGLAPTRLEILADNTVKLPNGELLADATYFRVGDNLVIRSSDGEVFIVRDYFVLGDRPGLVTEDGARLSPEMVDAFAQNHDAVEVAQVEGIDVPGAVAVVVLAEGVVTITRQDGTVEQATVNTQIFETDVIETGPDGGVHIIFADETSIVLSDGGRLSVDEYVFDSESNEGSSVFSVLKGMLAFVSGEIADNDPADVTFNTPVASFGIRGTAGGADVNPAPVPSSFFVVDGSIFVTSGGETVVLDEPLEQTIVENANTPPTPGVVLSPNEFQQNYAPILDLVPDFFPEVTENDVPDVNPEAGPNQGQNQPGSQGAQQNDGGTSQFVAFTDDAGSDGGDSGLNPLDVEGDGGSGQPLSGGGGPQPGGTGGSGDTVGTEVVFSDPPSDPGGPLNLIGTEGPDNLGGSNFNDVIEGSGGDDTVSGAGGNDILGGGAGNDIIDGGTGGDTITGGDGDDLLTGGAGDDVVFGGAGNDTIVAGVGEGNDEYHGDAGIDTVTYTSAVNNLLIDMPAGQTTGGPEIGTDSIDGIENATAGAGDDTIIGDAADNRLDGSGGSDFITAGEGDDSVVFDMNDASVDGGGGEDSLIVNAGNMDLTGIAPGQFTGFEVVDLSGGGPNALFLNAASLTALGGPGATLRVLGDADDLVDIGDGWTITGIQLVEGIEFSVYEQDGATLLVSNTIDQSNVNAVPTVSVGDGVPAPATEGTDPTITFTVTLSGPVNSDVTVDFTTLDGTALAGTDFTGTSGTLTFLAGQVSQDVTVTILDDSVFENLEDFTLEVSNGVFDPGGSNTALIITDDTGAGSIADDDPLPTVSIGDGTPDPAAESPPGTITFTVSLSNPSAFTVTADFTTVNGTATAGADYTETFGIVTFEPGQTTQTIVVPVLDDLVFEGPETFSVEISNAVQDPGGSNTGLAITDNSGTGNIDDNEPQPTVSIEAIDGQTDVTEGGVAAFRIFLEGGITSTEAITVALSSANGTAIGGIDFNNVQFYADAAATIPLTSNEATIAAGTGEVIVYVQTNQDLSVEGTEDYSLNIDSVVSGNAGIGTGSQTANILDDDVATVSIEAIGGQTDVTEGNVAAFRIFLEGGITSTEAITVALSSANGTATGGADFDNVQFYADAAATIPLTSNEATIAAGTGEVIVYVQTNQDLSVEGTEDYSLNIDSVVSGNAGIGTGSQTANILDDDVATVSIEAIGGQTDVTEGGVAAFRIFLEGGITSTEAITVALSSANGTATGGPDFDNVQFYADAAATIPLTSNEATIAAGSGEIIVYVQTNQDLIVEGTEDYGLNIDSVVSGNAGIGTGSQTANILDDDVATVSIEAIDGQTDVTEGNVAAFRIFIEGGVTSTEAITVALSSANGTATGGPDFDNVQFYADAAATIPLTSNEATIAAGTGEIIVYVQTNQDLIVEGTEDYSLNIDSVVSGNAGIGTGSQTANIVDDDVATVSIEAIDGQTDVTEGNVAAFRIFLEGGITSTEAITVALSATGITATGGPDFDNVQFYADAAATIPLTSNEATIAAGTGEVIVYVQTNQDLIVEGTEDYSLNIDSVVTANAGIGSGSQAANIFDDDVATVSIEAIGGQTDVTEGGVAAFRIFLEGGITSTEAITVALSATGITATGGPDFDNVQFYADAAATIPLTSNEATIAAGTGEVIVYVQTNQDLIVEGTEDYNLNIDSVVTGNAGIGTGSQAANILDDDVATVSVEAIDGQTDVTEGAVAAFRIFIEGGVTSTEAITVALSSTNGTATGGPDFDNVQFYADAAATIPLTSNEATIAAGTGEVIVYVQTNQDLIVEGTEDYSLNIDSVVTANAGIGSGSQAANIFDDDVATVSIEAIGGQTDVTEGGVAAFRIFLEGGITSTEAITVALSSTDGTAIGGADGEGGDFDNVQFYADAALTIPLTGNEITIPPGSNEIIVYVETFDDEEFEGTEDYDLNIDSVVSANATIGNGSQTGNILDNDTLPPNVDLNGPEGGGINIGPINYPSGSGAALIVASDATVSDLDSANLQSITIVLTNPSDGASEILAVNTAGTSIVANYVPGTGTLSLTGVDTVANYQAVLRTLTYENTSPTPTEGTRTVTVVANDGDGNSSVTAQSTVQVDAQPTADPLTIIHDESPGQQATTNDAAAIPAATVTALEAVFGVGDLPPVVGVAVNDLAYSGGGGAVSDVTFDNIVDLSDTTLDSDGVSIFFYRISDTLYLGSTDVSSLANAQSTAVFAIHLDANVGAETGSAAFVQFEPIDHPNTGDPNDSVSFTVDYTVDTPDLDTATNSLTFEVLDDGPDASALVIGVTDVTHDETAGVQNADGADDRSLDLLPGIFPGGAIGWAESPITIDDSAPGVYGTDGPGDTTLALTDGVGGAFSGDATNLFDTETGNRIFLYSVADNRVAGRVGTDDTNGADPGGAVAFEIVIEPGTNNLQLAQYRALEHPDILDPNDGVSLMASDGTSALVHIAATAADREGDQSTTILALGLGAIVFLDDAPAALADTDLSVSEGDFETSGTNLLANDSLGVDGAAVQSINYTDAGGLNQNAVVTPGGVTVQTQTGALTVASDGTWSFDPNASIDFGSAGLITESFSYTVIDGDGDGGIANQDIVINRLGEPGPGDDTVFGTKGNDTLQGFEGNDLLLGGAGNDLYLFNVGDGDDTINDTSGNDTIRILDGRLGGAGRVGNDLVIGYGLRGGSDLITVQNHFAGTGHEIETIDVPLQRSGGYTANILTGLTGTGANELITGGDGADSITGAGGHDFASGGIGNDTIDGGAGEDTLFGGVGNDSLIGGADFDTAWYFPTPGAITVDLTAGSNQVSDDGTGGMDTLTQIERIVGSNTGGDSMLGDPNDNTFEGRGGNDTMAAGAGNDTYGIHIDGGQDEISDTGGLLDTLKFHGAQLSSAERVGDHLLFRHSTDYSSHTVTVVFGTGNQPIETVQTFDPSDPYGAPTGTYQFASGAPVGTGGNDFLVALGTGGSEAINGGAGNDWINGHVQNADSLVGGLGDDVLVGDSFSDTVPGSNDTLEGGEGSDTYHVFGAGGSDLILETSGAADTIVFFAQPLRSAERVDQSLVLRYGDNIDGDTVTVSNQFFLGDAVEHIKLLDINDVSNTFATYTIRNDTTGTAGNDFIVGVGPGNFNGEQFFGGPGDDWLNGTNAGNDTFFGGAGTDVLIGMGGDDLYRIGNGDGFTFISEFKTGGSDTIRYEGPAILWWAVRTDDGTNSLRIDFNQFGTDTAFIVDQFGNAGSKVETINLNATGYTATIATGTAGTAGNDLIVGFDRLITGTNETIDGGNADDIIWAGGDGVSGFGDLILGNNGNDLLVASLFGDDTLDGGSGDDFLSGVWGDNSLLGGLGNDTLEGDGGTDTLDGGSGVDFVSYEFTDGLNGNFAVSIDLANNQATDFEGNVDTVLNIDNAIGSFQDDQIVGSSVANQLIGAAGGDTMTGGDGGDSFIWRALSDLDFDNDDLVDGIDQLTDFSGAIDGDAIDISDLLSDLDIGAGSLNLAFRTVIDGSDNSKVNLQIDFSVTGTAWQTFATVSSGDGLTGAALETDIDNNIITGF